MLDGGFVVWAVLWLLAGILVYSSVRRLEDYGETTATAAAGLRQTSEGLVRASRGLRTTGSALRQIPFVGERIDDTIGLAARDLEEIARTVATTAGQARASAEQAREASRDSAIVLGAAVALAPTVPFAVLYLLLRPLIAARLRGE